MNILIPHQWLLEHLKTEAKPSEIAKLLSLSGPSVERIEKVLGDSVYDIEVTANRVDAMSVRGIAREAAAILPEFEVKAKLIPLETPQINSTKPLDITIKNDPALCKRILAIKLEAVKIGPSPQWLQDRLHQVGQRPLNNVIDITNYIMWEIGHPIHAFDYDRLTQKTIIVREAKPGENLITLDDQKKVLQGGEVIFDDGTGNIIDLPGIMGTKNTVVTDTTQNVLLWIESVDAVRIRQASMNLNLRSQAAILNEKHVDPVLGKTAILQAIKLYQEVTKAKIGSQLVDIYPHPEATRAITVKQSLIDTYLGLKLKPKQISRILEHLEFQTKYDESAASYLVTPPNQRGRDLTIPQDVIEEIARIYGYHNLPSQIMATPIPDTPSDDNFALEYQLKQWLAGWGAQEIYTYSMVSKKLALQSEHPLANHLQLKNPLSDDWVYMRRSLIPSLVEVLKQNPTYETVIFELQKVYHPSSDSTQLPQEEVILSLATNQSFDRLKGIIDLLMDKLHTQEAYRIKTTKTQPMFQDNAVGTITLGDTKVGQLGRLKIDPGIFAASISIKKLQPFARTHPTQIKVYENPPIIEDYTFTLPPMTPIGEVIDTLYQGSKLVNQVHLKTQYQNNVTFTVNYRHPHKPLSVAKLEPDRKAVINQVIKKHQAKLVGEI
jgi:phenylalanyl-tRNA synthetase beta chain